MLALHATWNGSALAFWAETSEEAPRRRGRPPKGARPHPFAANAEAIRHALPALPTAEPVQLQLVLPADGARPLPSPALPQHAPKSAPALAPFRVEALPIPAGRAVPALAPRAREAQWDGVVLGADVQWWARAAAFLASLVARGRLLPELRESPWRASWRPLASEPSDQALLARLVEEMPPSCRAAGGSARAILEDFLAVATREWLAGMTCQAPTAPRTWPSEARAWVAALAGEGLVKAKEALLTRLAADLRAWVEASGLDSAWRAGFRLEPPEDGRSWAVDLSLDSTRDASLQVAAELLWSGRQRLPEEPRPQERLLRELGRVRPVFPEVERALATSKPVQVQLSGVEAVAFLRERAPLLQELGCAVRLPTVFGPKDLALKARAKSSGSSSPSSGRMGLDEIVAFRWDVALGDDPMELGELEELARLKQPLVQWRGRWVLLDPEQVERMLAALGKDGQTARLGDLLRLAGGLGPAPLPGARVEITFEGALEALREGAAPAPLATPAGLQATLRPYQERGYSWLSFLRDRGLGACLADDMGLGKTIQTLAVLLRDREHGEERQPSLLVCPTSVVGNWAREIQKFAPELAFRLHHGPDRPTGAGFAEAVQGLDLVLTSYALARRDAETLATVPWRHLVLDEAQNIKNPDSGQARALRALEAGWRVALTGTPVENHLTDLWSLMEFLNPGLLGPRKAFTRDFVVPVQRLGDTSPLPRLKRLVGPFLLRRVKSDPAIAPDLPEKQEIKTFCPLTREQASLYQATLQEMLEEVEGREGIERRGVVLALLLRLKQICNHPALYLGDGSALPGRSGKLERLEEMLEEVLEEGDRALIFSQFAEFAQRLARHLQERFGRPVLCLHGQVSREERDRMVEEFQSEGGPPLFVLSLKAGGVGLNLTRASRVFHFDRWWNPAVENQATDRAYRIGQTRGVQVFKFVCSGTMEEAIDQLIESKTALAESIVGSGENWLTELDDGRLRELLALREVPE